MQIINGFIDSKYGIEAVAAVVVYIFVTIMLVVLSQSLLPWLTVEGRKNAAGFMAAAFVAIVEWKRFSGVSI